VSAFPTCGHRRMYCSRLQLLGGGIDSRKATHEIAMKSENILNAAASLLGVALLIVTVVHVSGGAARSSADEIAFASAILFIGSCMAAHLAIGKADKKFDAVADKLFFFGLLTLLFGVLSFWF
jgi:hypothetical protein